jgi:L-asparagine transporter-like permease
MNQTALFAFAGAEIVTIAAAESGEEGGTPTGDFPAP